VALTTVIVRQEIVVTVPHMNFHKSHLVGVVLLHVDRHCKVSDCFSQSLCYCTDTGL